MKIIKKAKKNNLKINGGGGTEGKNWREKPPKNEIKGKKLSRQEKKPGKVHTEAQWQEKYSKKGGNAPKIKKKKPQKVEKIEQKGGKYTKNLKKYSTLI